VDGTENKNSTIETKNKDSVIGIEIQDTLVI
jgi:hypothetical protein